MIHMYKPVRAKVEYFLKMKLKNILVVIKKWFFVSFKVWEEKFSSTYFLISKNDSSFI